MKTLLFLLLGGALMGQPLFVERGSLAAGLVRKGPVPMTGSMRPFIHGGEFLHVSPYVGQPLQVGDVLEAITMDGRGVLHRVTAQNKRAVYLSGDANRHSDGWIPKTPTKFGSKKPGIISVVRAIERPAVSSLAQVR